MLRNLPSSSSSPSSTSDGISERNFGDAANSPTESSSFSFLQSCKRKLCHNLPEVRARALHRLCEKVAEGDIQTVTLGYDRDLFVNLLNLAANDTALAEPSLALLHNLTQNSTCNRTLASVGGIDALQAIDRAATSSHPIRKDMCKKLLARLFSLPLDNQKTHVLLQESAKILSTIERSISSSSSSVSSVTSESAASRLEHLYNLMANAPTEPLTTTRSRFGQVELTRHDAQFLFDLNLRLRVSDRATVIAALNSLSSHVLLDFPPEVVLQRPELFNNLLSLLAISDHSSGVDVHVLYVLRQLGQRLASSAMWQRTEDWMHEPVHCAVLGIDSDDWAATSPSTMRSPWYPSSIPSHDSLPLSYAAHLVLVRCLPLLKSQGLAPYVRELILVWLPLAAETNSEDFVPRAMQWIAELAAVAIGLGSVSLEASPHAAQHVVLADILALFAPHLLSTQAKTIAIPPVLIELASEVCLSPLVYAARPKTVEALIPWLSAVHQPAKANLESIHRVEESLKHCELFGNVEVSPLKRLENVKQAIPALIYQHELIRASVMEVLQALLLIHIDSDLRDSNEEVKSLILALVSFEEVGAREQSLSAFLEFLKRDESDAQIVFKYYLLDSDILYQMVTVDIFGKDGEPEREIVLQVLSILSLAAAILPPQLVASALVPIVPFLQSLLALDQIHPNCSALLALVSLCIEEEEKLVLTARLLFHRNARIRAEASNSLTQTLGLSKAASLAVSADPFVDIPTRSEILWPSYKSDTATTPADIAESSQKLLSVMLNTNLKTDIRIAAADQLAALVFSTDDEALIATCIPTSGLLKIALDELRSGSPFRLCFLRVLRLLAEKSSLIREELRKPDAFYSLVSAVMQPRRDICTEAAMCIAIILFDMDVVQRACIFRSTSLTREDVVVNTQPIGASSSSNNNSSELYYSSTLGARSPLHIVGALSFGFQFFLPILRVELRNEIFSRDYGSWMPQVAAAVSCSAIIRRSGGVVALCRQSLSEATKVGEESAAAAAAAAAAAMIIKPADNSKRVQALALQVFPMCVVKGLVEAAETANSHSNYADAIRALHAACAGNYSYSRAFLDCSWGGAISAALNTAPALPEDEEAVLITLELIISSLRTCCFFSSIDNAAEGILSMAKAQMLMFQSLSPLLRLGSSHVVENDDGLSSYRTLISKNSSEMKSKKNALNKKLMIAVMDTMKLILETCPSLTLLETASADGSILPILTSGLLAQTLEEDATHNSNANNNNNSSSNVHRNESTDLVRTCLELACTLTRNKQWRTSLFRNRVRDEGYRSLSVVVSIIKKSSGSLNFPATEEHQALDFVGKGLSRLSLFLLAQCCADKQFATWLKENHLRPSAGEWLSHFLRDRHAVSRVSSLFIQGVCDIIHIPNLVTLVQNRDEAPGVRAEAFHILANLIRSKSSSQHNFHPLDSLSLDEGEEHQHDGKEKGILAVLQVDLITISILEASKSDLNLSLVAGISSFLSAMCSRFPQWMQDTLIDKELWPRLVGIIDIDSLVSKATAIQKLNSRHRRIGGSLDSNHLFVNPNLFISSFNIAVSLRCLIETSTAIQAHDMLLRCTDIVRICVALLGSFPKYVQQMEEYLGNQFHSKWRLQSLQIESMVAIMSLLTSLLRRGGVEGAAIAKSILSYQEPSLYFDSEDAYPVVLIAPYCLLQRTPGAASSSAVDTRSQTPFDFEQHSRSLLAVTSFLDELFSAVPVKSSSATTETWGSIPNQLVSTLLALHCDLATTTPGSEVSTATTSSSSSSSLLRQGVASALCAILSCSTSAKSFALSQGVATEWIMLLASLAAKLDLNIAAARPAEITLSESHRAVQREASTVCTLLHAFISHYLPAKETVCNANLTRIAAQLLLHCLKTRGESSHHLSLAVLDLILSLVADCAVGQSAVASFDCDAFLAQSSPKSSGDNLSGNPSSSSGKGKIAGKFNNNKIQGASNPSSPSTSKTKGPLLRLIFSLIKGTPGGGTEVAVAAARIVAACGPSPVATTEAVRSNWFTELCSTLQVALKTKNQDLIPTITSIFVGFSYSTEGQIAISRTKGFLELAVDIAKLSEELKEQVILLLRNLCFAHEAKPHITASQPALSLLIDGAASRARAAIIAYACNGLWALLYNNQKAKFILRERGVPEIATRTKGVVEAALSNLERQNISSSSDNATRHGLSLLHCARNSCSSLEELLAIVSVEDTE